MFITKESRSNNYKENVARSFPAVQQVIQLLFSTPQMSMPFSLGLGFELKDMLFKIAGSDTEQAVITELNTQVRAIVGDESIDVNFSRDGSTINLIINFTYDNANRRATVPVLDLGDDKFEISFKDIIVI
ncbi:MAG: hypothetical protein ACRCX2_20190 [Paraclostridium sp.]